jgi:O-acetyl-ADP-ribose deacetylase (regulator of RNase III)
LCVLFFWRRKRYDNGKGYLITERRGYHMNQDERRLFLIKRLLAEQKHWNGTIPEGESQQKRLLRSCMNVRMPAPIDDEFLDVQDAYLKEESKRKGITDAADLTPAKEGIYLWQGDITTLRCDAIVNAANSGMTGCYVPCHACIDNCIHTFAGVQLRLDCARLIEQQGHEEETGRAKITPAYNLPCRYVLHTVGPIVRGSVTREHERLLASCYRSCLELAEKNGVKSLAFCCISTGVFCFPNERAAEIAIQTVQDYQKENHSEIEVIFNVFKNEDYEIYRRLLDTI